MTNISLKDAMLNATELAALYRVASFLQSSRITGILKLKATRFPTVGEATIKKLYMNLKGQFPYRLVRENREMVDTNPVNFMFKVGSELEKALDLACEQNQVSVPKANKQFKVARGQSVYEVMYVLAETIRADMTIPRLHTIGRFHNATILDFDTINFVAQWVSWAISLNTLTHDTGLPFFEQIIAEFASDDYFVNGWPCDLLVIDRQRIEAGDGRLWTTDEQMCSTRCVGSMDELPKQSHRVIRTMKPSLQHVA